jgi:Domain of unknown function (DUF6456)
MLTVSRSTSNPSAADRKAMARLAMALSEKSAKAVLKDSNLLVEASPRGVSLRRASFEPAIGERLVCSGAAAWHGLKDKTKVLTLTDAGHALARRLASGEDAFLDQHREAEQQSRNIDGQTMTVSVNLKENPLLWLHRRRGRNEAPLIDDAGFAAGERFRADFERAGMQQRTTIDWSRLGANTDGGRGSEPSDVMMSARNRVEAALAAVGPDFAGPLIDLICFHKGLEQLERERDWPARSGKVLIRFALAALARHYGYQNVAKGAVNDRGIRLWKAPLQGSDVPGLAADAIHQ